MKNPQAFSQHATQREPEMVEIPEGEFLMGCETGAASEKPVHSVRIDRFWISRTVVTNGLYTEFTASTAYSNPPGWDDPAFNHPQQPVTSVNWFDAVAFCEWLSRIMGVSYRLPTVAEWERAARGGREGKLFTWGDEPPQNQPGYEDLWKTGPEQVGLRPPNGFGLYDISENVHEWCLDWFGEGYYAVSPEVNPRGPESGVRRSSRGGSWRHQVKITRVAARSSIPPQFRYSDYGFRIVRSAK
jgi:formylglycine-generating enzyme